MFRSDIWRLSEALMAALWMAICNVSAGVNKTAEGSVFKSKLVCRSSNGTDDADGSGALTYSASLAPKFKTPTVTTSSSSSLSSSLSSGSLGTYFSSALTCWTSFSTCFSSAWTGCTLGLSGVAVGGGAAFMERTQLCPDLLGMRPAAMTTGEGGSGESGVCGADDKSMEPIRSTDELRLLLFQLNFLSKTRLDIRRVERR